MAAVQFGKSILTIHQSHAFHTLHTMTLLRMVCFPLYYTAAVCTKTALMKTALNAQVTRQQGAM